MDPVTGCLIGLILMLVAALLWMMWLYLVQYRQLTVCNRDRDRLIRRIGIYHSLPLITPHERLPDLPAETPIPPAFRMKRPIPPPGYRPSKGDL